MNRIFYIRPEPGVEIHTKIGKQLDLDRVCKIGPHLKMRETYFLLVEQTQASFSGIRLQQDEYNPYKFYLTGEKNSWPGISSTGRPLIKGRWITVYDHDDRV